MRTAHHLTVLVVLGGLLLTATITPAHTPPEEARVYFIGIADGDVVEGPVTVSFGIEGFGIVPAGTRGKERHYGGHHHLLINVEGLPDLDEPIPFDANHRHFSGGETEARLDLPPGTYTLQLLLGDESHEPQDPPLYSEPITITVRPPG